jgi:hypothetical protein
MYYILHYSYTTFDKIKKHGEAAQAFVVAMDAAQDAAHTATVEAAQDAAMDEVFFGTVEYDATVRGVQEQQQRM